jgi:hypothetical protein
MVPVYLLKDLVDGGRGVAKKAYFFDVKIVFCA